MPLFDLQCKDCSKEFSKLVSYDALSKVKCPDCSSPNYNRIYRTSVRGPVSRNSNYAQASSGFS